MSASLVGESCALGAALAWAFALVLFNRTFKTLPAKDMSDLKATDT